MPVSLPSLLALTALVIGPGGLPQLPSPKPRPTRGAVPKGPLKPIRPAPPNCRTHTVVLPDITLPPMLVHEGDTEVAGWARLNVNTALRTRGTALELTGKVQVQAVTPGDSTKFVRHFSKTIPVLPAHSRCVVTKVIDGGAARAAEILDDEHRFIDFHGSKYLEKAECRVDTNGDDDGKVQCRRLHFRSVRVQTAPRPLTMCDPVRLNVPALTLTAPTHQRGDTEMGGNRVSLRVDAKVRQRRDQVLVDTTAIFEESVPDHTTFRGTDSRVVFDAAIDAPGCRVVSVGYADDPHKSTDSRVRALAWTNQHQPRRFGGQSKEGLLEHAVCRTDTKGNDRGKLGCSEIEFRRPLTVHLEKR